MYLFIDTETGGLDPSYSLLTVAAAVTDKNFEVLGTICFGIKPETYVVSPEAIGVNKIDLVQHAKSSLSPAKANADFAEFLAQHFSGLTANQKLIPAGHNVAFDLNFVWDQLMSEKEWKQYCTYPVLDTAVLARFFASAGVIPGFYNLVALRQLFVIETGEAHNAMSDVLAAIELAKKFYAILGGATPLA